MIHDADFDGLTTTELYGILQLRSAVFVVEQECPYLDPDGRDIEPLSRHVWTERNGQIDAYLRVLDEGDARRIGRVVTSPDARGAGVAARLITHVLDTTAAPWVLDAQAHLTGWYERFGFVIAGIEYLEDGIPHVPMRRP